MSARGKARKRALDLLYASEMRSESPVAALERAVEAGEGPTNPYTTELVRGVVERQSDIDRILSMYSESWTLERMPAVDRNVLRIGVLELLWAEDVPEAVAVSEALVLVRDLSTDDSPTYVNGVLGAVLRDKPTLLEDIATRASEDAGDNQ
ncbi:MAG: transcription antitermination factor NusB [Nocardioides sp.]|uniref:transcription antitermination factor NusB n=1 Tax=Nocardioides sp. TaxID=35761 RepID=UPI003F052645